MRKNRKIGNGMLWYAGFPMYSVLLHRTLFIIYTYIVIFPANFPFSSYFYCSPFFLLVFYTCVNRHWNNTEPYRKAYLYDAMPYRAIVFLSSWTTLLGRARRPRDRRARTYQTNAAARARLIGLPAGATPKPLDAGYNVYTESAATRTTVTAVTALPVNRIARTHTHTRNPKSYEWPTTTTLQHHRTGI